MKRQRKELIYHNIISVHKTVIYPLLIAFVVSCFNVPATALSTSGSFDNLSDEALPTEAPEISEAAEVLPDIRTDDDNYVLPEKADKRLVDDRMDVSYTKEELYGDPQKHSFEEIYFSYMQLISGDEEYIEKLNGLYGESISGENETAYDILSPYFDDNNNQRIRKA